jgi:hypothetical protein
VGPPTAGDPGKPTATDPLILIGGQALNHWCDRYRVANPDLEQHGPFASKDLDFQATRNLIPWCSKQLGGECTLAEAGDKSLLNGAVTLHPTPGTELRLDFMQRAYGLQADEVARSSAPVEVTWEGSTFVVRVMHPLHCMKSRVKNVMGLPDQYANDHGIRQLKASIACLRLFIEEVAAGDERLGAGLNEKVFEFALHDLDAERLYRARKIDVFDAASNAKCLPGKFRTIRYPQMLRELAKRRQ